MSAPSIVPMMHVIPWGTGQIKFISVQNGPFKGQIIESPHELTAPKSCISCCLCKTADAPLRLQMPLRGLPPHTPIISSDVFQCSFLPLLPRALISRTQVPTPCQPPTGLRISLHCLFPGALLSSPFPWCFQWIYLLPLFLCAHCLMGHWSMLVALSSSVGVSARTHTQLTGLYARGPATITPTVTMTIPRGGSVTFPGPFTTRTLPEISQGEKCKWSRERPARSFTLKTQQMQKKKGQGAEVGPKENHYEDFTQHKSFRSQKHGLYQRTQKINLLRLDCCVQVLEPTEGIN